PSSVADPPTPALHTLSLHDALPIFRPPRFRLRQISLTRRRLRPRRTPRPTPPTINTRRPPIILHRINPHRRRKRPRPQLPRPPRSDEHTSELQSRLELVCRLLLEKK